MKKSMTIWSARFLALGVSRRDVVATVLDAGLESVAVWLGLASIGAVDAATNPEFRGRMLVYAINNCAPTLLVAASQHLGAVDAVATDLKTVARVLVVDEKDETALAVTALPAPTQPSDVEIDIAEAREVMSEPEFHDIACITYTSGTTGPSKAVRLPWGQLHSINSGTFPLEDLTSDDVFYCTTSHAHFGSKSIPYNAAMVGGQVVMRSRFALSRFWNDIDEFGVTTGMLVGSMADVLLRDPSSPKGATTLTNLFMAPLGPNYRQFGERFGVRICTVYNSTGGGVAIRSGWNPANEHTVGRLRQGYPGFEVRLVDTNDYEVPDGTPGECAIRAREPWVMNAGYLNNDSATASAWQIGRAHV